MVHNIRVTMLGDFSVYVDGKPVQEHASKLTKPWQVFCYLALHRGRTVPSQELMEELWEPEELTDPANVLKNTVYALRRELAGSTSPSDSPIQFSKGGYHFSPAVTLELDTDIFEQLYQKAQQTTGDTQQSTEAFMAAEQAFFGELLPQLDHKTWVIPFARRCRQSYIACSHGLCEGLYRQDKFHELLNAAMRATVIDPVDEQSILYTFRAMQALQMHRAVIATYGKTARYFESETGRPLCAEIQRIYRAASEKINKSEQDLAVICEDLMQTAARRQAEQGAYFCDYEVFKYTYMIVARTAARNKQVVNVILVTLQDAGGHIPSARILGAAMSELKAAIACTLRKSDLFSRYGKNQYVLMLPMSDEQDTSLVHERLDKAFREITDSGHLRLCYESTSLPGD